MAMSEWDRIIADLHNMDDTDRAVAACEALDKAANETWLPQLHSLLVIGRDFFVREAAAGPIARLEGLRALPQLLEAQKLGEDEGHDNDGLNALISDLVWDDPEAAAPILTQMLEASSDVQRSGAAWLWGFAAKALTPEPLLARLRDPSAHFRSYVIDSLGSFKDREDVFAALLDGLNDFDERVRTSAASALGYYGDQRAVPVLRELRSDSSEAVRRIVKAALKQLGHASWTLPWPFGE